METVELFSGTKSFSKVAQLRNHKIFTIDNQSELHPDLCVDFLEWDGYLAKSGKFDEKVFRKDIIWASPPCTTFSVASAGKHWTGGKGAYIPKTEACKKGLELLGRTIFFIKWCQPKIWFIENPRGVMRKVIDIFFEQYDIREVKRHTVTYCQYGDTRMKPTDIWTNCDIQFKPMCKNGAPCHEAAPRGSKTGTQGLKGAKERGAIPKKLMLDIIKYCEKQLKPENLFPDVADL